MEIKFQLKPNEYILCRHNSEGNRDSPFVKEKNLKPILCLGGSHTWGVGVGQEERYTDLLGKMIGKSVLNLGHCSLGLDQICLAILKKSHYYQPSVIIVEQYPWAIHRILSPYVNGYIRPYFYLDDSGELALNKMSALNYFKIIRRIIGAFYEYRKEFFEFRSGINLKEGYDPWSDPIFLYWKTAYYDYMYSLADKILSVMQDFCHQKGIHLLFGLSAIMQQFGKGSPSSLVDYELPKKRLITLLEKNRIPFVDMTNSMINEHTTSEPVIYSDGHINEKGHQIFARELTNSMEKKNWLD
jgi:hypothetical protein